MSILPAGFIEPDEEQKAVSAELKRDEYKRILDRIHTITLGCTSRNTVAYVELPAAIQEIISARHKQWERAIKAEQRIEAALDCLQHACFDAASMAAIKKLKGE